MTASLRRWSHPHGCVSWNFGKRSFNDDGTVSHPHGCVSWNPQIFQQGKRRGGSHPHGCVSWNQRHKGELRTLNSVTPSRVCELKCVFIAPNLAGVSHTLTGVWVEILLIRISAVWHESHPHGCVSWNLNGRSILWSGHVTPSRVCELKCSDDGRFRFYLTVTPSRVCELKWWRRKRSCQKSCHTLTGVWVEMLKHETINRWQMSHPHGCVSWNSEMVLEDTIKAVTPSRVCELKCGRSPWWA